MVRSPASPAELPPRILPADFLCATLAMPSLKTAPAPKARRYSGGPRQDQDANDRSHAARMPRLIKNSPETKRLKAKGAGITGVATRAQSQELPRTSRSGSQPDTTLLGLHPWSEQPAQIAAENKAPRFIRHIGANDLPEFRPHTSRHEVPAEDDALGTQFPHGHFDEASRRTESRRFHPDVSAIP